MIAPEPISATVPSGTGRHSRMASERRAQAAVSKRDAVSDASLHFSQAPADILPPLPPPPDPPGTAYVAAVLSGALSPKPISAREVFFRIGEWTPPDSPLHLADKTV